MMDSGGRKGIRMILLGLMVLVFAGSIQWALARTQQQTPTFEELVSWVELLRARQEALTGDVNDFKAEVAGATAALRAEMASEDAAVRAEMAAEDTEVRAEMATAFSIAAPPGTIAAFFGTAAPAGWLICDGTPIPQGEEYNALRALVGPNTPDLRGRVILMADPSAAVLQSATVVLGATGGEETHLLIEGEMPAHNHYFQVNTLGYPDGGGDTGGSYAYWNYWRPERSNIYTTTSGGNLPHNNMPPYFALNWIIKY